MALLMTGDIDTYLTDDIPSYFRKYDTCCYEQGQKVKKR